LNGRYQQGAFQVAGQFRFASEVGVDRTFSRHVAVFREAFALHVIAAENVELLQGVPAENRLQPGFLKRGQLADPSEG
jgi:hypothetical protein